MTHTDIAQIGHNNPPAFDPKVVETLRAEAAALVEKNKEWIALGKIQTEEQAALAADHIAGLRAVKARATKAKADAKKPHDDAGKLVVAAFDPVIDGATTMISTALKMQGDYLQQKQAEMDRKRDEEIAAANQRREAAEAAAEAAAQSGDAIAEAEAQRIVKEAQKAEVAAARPVTARVGSATGGGSTISMRTRRVARITNSRALLIHFQDHPDVLATIQSLANAHVRAANFDGVDLPGTKTETEKTAS